MKLGIIGLPSSGKTTIFNALTMGNAPTGQGMGGRFDETGSGRGTAVVDVRDPRVGAPEIDLAERRLDQEFGVVRAKRECPVEIPRALLVGSSEEQHLGEHQVDHAVAVVELERISGLTLIDASKGDPR